MSLRSNSRNNVRLDVESENSVLGANSFMTKMTKYRISTLPFQAFTLPQFLGDLAEIGVSSIELAKGHFDTLDAETARSLQEDFGLNFKSMLSTEDIASSNGLDTQIAILDIAQSLSIDRVCISSGGREEASENEIAMIIDRLKILTQQAERRNVTLAFYPHHGWMAYNLDRTERIFEEITSDNFQYYYCSYHFQRAGDDPVDALEHFVDRLCSVYFDCGVDPVTGDTPLWAPETDYRAVCKAIQNVTCDGEIMLIYLGLECDTPTPIIEGLLAAGDAIDTLMA